MTLSLSFNIEQVCENIKSLFSVNPKQALEEVKLISGPYRESWKDWLCEEFPANSQMIERQLGFSGESENID